MVALPNTGSLRKHKPCRYQTIICDCKDLQQEHKWAAPIQPTANKSTCKFPSGFSFKTVLHSLPKKSQQNAPTLQEGELFYPSSLNFCHSEFNYITASLQHMLSFALIYLENVCEHHVLPNVMKDLLIVRVILGRWSAKTLIPSSLKR